MVPGSAPLVVTHISRIDVLLSLLMASRYPRALAPYLSLSLALCLHSPRNQRQDTEIKDRTSKSKTGHRNLRQDSYDAKPPFQHDLYGDVCRTAFDFAEYRSQAFPKIAGVLLTGRSPLSATRTLCHVRYCHRVCVLAS